MGFHLETILIVSAIAIVVGWVVTLWRRSGPGKRLRFGAVNLYYTPSVSADEANRVGNYLLRQKLALDNRLTRIDTTYQLQLICYRGHRDEKQEIACEILAAGLSDEVFAGGAVEVHICDNIFRSISVVTHRGRFGRRIVMNAARLFYLEGVTDSQALEVATFLAAVGVFDDSPKVAQLNRNADGYEFRLAVDTDPLPPEMVEGARQMANDLSAKVLKNAPVAVDYCRGLRGTLRTESADIPRATGGAYRSQVFHKSGEIESDL